MPPLFYQDFNEQFEGYTQLRGAFVHEWGELFYQDFNEQFEGYTQLLVAQMLVIFSCFIRISMNNLKDIHNSHFQVPHWTHVVLSGFQ